MPSAYAQDVTAHTVYYNHNSAETSEIKNQLNQIVNSCNFQRIEIVCHTDTTGSAAYNQSLSERRAVDLMNDLIGLGVSQNLMSTSGQGETNNVIDRGDNVREEANRRCEIVTTCEAAYVEPVQQEVYQTYEAPVQETYTENVTEWVDSTPAPIQEQVVVQQPAPAPEVYYQPAPPPVATPAPPPPPPPPPPPLPPVASGGGFLGGISPVVLVGGLAAVVAAGVIIADGDNDDDDDDDLPASP